MAVAVSRPRVRGVRLEVASESTLREQQTMVPRRDGAAPPATAVRAARLAARSEKHEAPQGRGEQRIGQAKAVGSVGD